MTAAPKIAIPKLDTSRLTPGMLAQMPADLMAALLQNEWEAAKADPMHFLRWFAFTLDQHDPVHPIKRFPAERPYIEPLVRMWQDNKLQVICKTRQVMLTWLYCNLSLWDAMMRTGRSIVLQSMTYDDAAGSRIKADGLLGRCQFILDHIPLGKMLVPKYSDKVGVIEFHHNSGIEPIAQGEAKMQGRTVSGFFSDEAARQEQFEGSLGSVLPTLRGEHTWAVFLSTADTKDRGAFKRLYLDLPEA